MAKDGAVLAIEPIMELEVTDHRPLTTPFDTIQEDLPPLVPLFEKMLE